MTSNAAGRKCGCGTRDQRPPEAPSAEFVRQKLRLATCYACPERKTDGRGTWCRQCGPSTDIGDPTHGDLCLRGRLELIAKRRIDLLTADAAARCPLGKWS